jgi:hypothetical protein
MSNTSAAIFGAGPALRERRIRVTLTATRDQIARQSDWAWYGGTTVVESFELVEPERQVHDGWGLVTKAARYRATFAVTFSATAQAANAAGRLCGVIRGLGGTAEEF